MVGLCVAIMIRRSLFFNVRSKSIISCEVSGSRAAVNSSAKIRGGSFKMIFAKAINAHLNAWYHSDLKLIVVILFTLPLETVISICDEVIERLNDYSDYTEILPTKYELLSNLASIFLWNGLMEKCTSISYLLLDTAKKSKRYDFLGNAKVTLGICSSDKKLVDEGL